MEFSDILKLPKGSVVPEIRGRVTKVYEAYRPSPAQDRAGIHKQPVILQNDNGETLCIDILSKEHHLPFSAEGGIWVFRSVAAENGAAELQGLSVDIWTGDKGENFSVQCNRKAHFYEETAAADAPQPAGPVHNWQHEAQFYCQVLTEFENRIGSTPVWEAMLKEPHSLTAAVSSVYIECGRNGTKSAWIREQLRQAMPYPMQHAKTAPAAPTQPRPQERPAPPVQQEAAPAAQPSTLTHKPTTPTTKETPEAEIALMIYGGIPTDKVKELVSKVFGAAQPNFEAIMDSLFTKLQNDGVQLCHIHTAYDWAKEAIRKNAPPDKPVRNDAVCKNIAYGFGRFKDLIDDAKRQGAPPAPGIGETQNSELDGLTPLD